MVLISTYRSKRLVSTSFLQNYVMRARAVADFYFVRPWNGTMHFAIPADGRIWAVCVPLIYFLHRWQNDHSLEKDNVEKSMINRWGGSLEAVRATLSPQDQLRVRAFVDLEKLYSSYGPKDTLIQPAGCTLPGKNYYSTAAHH